MGHKRGRPGTSWNDKVDETMGKRELRGRDLGKRDEWKDKGTTTAVTNAL